MAPVATILHNHTMESTQLITSLLRELQDPMMRMERTVQALTDKTEALTQQLQAQQEAFAVCEGELVRRLEKQERGLRSLAELYQLDLLIMRQEKWGSNCFTHLLHGCDTYGRGDEGYHFQWSGFELFKREHNNYELNIVKAEVKAEWEAKTVEEQERYNMTAALCNKTNFRSQNARARELIASLDA